MTKEVAKKEESALTTMNFAEDSGSGFEAMGADDMAIPFISILQSLSPQCKKSEEKYVKGAEEGMFINTATNEIFNGYKGIKVVPCFFEKVFLEWKPKRAGLAGMHPKDTPLLRETEKNDKGQDVLTNGNILSPTAQYYCLMNNKEKYDKVVISMSSTGLKVSRRWNRSMATLSMKDGNGKDFIPPMYSHIYTLKSTPESNDQGSWMNWLEDAGTPITDRYLYDLAKRFNKEAVAGRVKITQSSEENIPF